MEQDRHVENEIQDRAGAHPSFAIAYALLRLADAQASTAAALRMLGTGDAATPLGAIEALMVAVEKVADAIRDSAP